MKKLKSKPKDLWRSFGLTEREAKMMSTIRAKRFHIINDKLKRKK